MECPSEISYEEDGSFAGRIDCSDLQGWFSGWVGGDALAFFPDEGDFDESRRVADTLNDRSVTVEMEKLTIDYDL